MVPARRVSTAVSDAELAISPLSRVAHPHYSLQCRPNQDAALQLPGFISSPPPAKTTPTVAIKPSPSPYLPRSILSTSCRAIPLLTSVRFVHRSDGNAAVPTTLGSTHQRPPPVTSVSHSTKETTSGRALSPSTSPWSPLQKPPRFPADGEASMEIAVIFFNSGRQLPSLFPSSPLVDRSTPSTSTRSSQRRRDDPTAAIAVQTFSDLTPTLPEPSCRSHRRHH